jgi:hypothetical protein
MWLPGPPSPWPKRRRPWRWLRSLAERFDLWALAVVILALIVLWASTIPSAQTVEGSVQTRAVSFELSPPTQEGTSEAFIALLEENVREMSLNALDPGEPVSFPMKGATVRVEPGQPVNFSAAGNETFVVTLHLPPGTRVENLHGETETRRGKETRELVLDLRSPSGSRASTANPLELSLLPPPPLVVEDEEPPRGQPAEPLSGLLATQQSTDGPVRRLPTPEGSFSLMLRGDARLRLRLVNPSVDFEPNLPVREVTFSTVKQIGSERRQRQLPQSDIRKGTLYFARRDPLELRANQFLVMNPPGIQEFTHLSLVNNEVIALISGQTNRLTTGLSPNRPSTEITGTLLSRHLSSDQIPGFYGVLAGVIGSMVLVFFRAY